jgi:hypothetical protein
MSTLKRMFIYPKDIQRMSGKTDRSARKLITKIRFHLGKQKHQLVTIKEFCTFMKLPEEEVLNYITD